MPAIEDFPPQVKKQIEVQQGRIEIIAAHAEKKKPGLFQRLASVGLGRKDDPAPSQREPTDRHAARRTASRCRCGRRPSRSRSRCSMRSPTWTMISWRSPPSCAVRPTD